MNIENILGKASKQLKSLNIKNANLDCEVLLSSTINKDREYLIFNLKQNLDKKYIDFFYNLIERRKKGEPVAYLINKKEFWKETFYVNNEVLIPRPDTEHLIEEVIKYTYKDSKLHILDIGTGSGCILLSILRERKSKIGTGDRSERIRTYNFPQGRVTDHRINLTIHKLEEFLDGDAFHEINENLRIQDQELKLKNLEKFLTLEKLNPQKKI